MPVHEHAAKEAARYPTNHVMAIIPDRQEAEQAAQALRVGGFTHVERLSGSAAYQAVQRKMNEQHPLDKLWERIRHALTEEGMEQDAYLDALRQGQSVVMVRVASAEDAAPADAILRRYHAHSVLHFGQWTISNLPDATAR